MPEHRDYKAAQNHLINAFNILAPTGKSQRALISALHEMELDGEDSRLIFARLTGYLLDGVQYGNWIGEV